MKSYLEILEEVRTKKERNTAEEHLKDIATLLAILCDKIDLLDGDVEWLTESIRTK